MEGHRALRAGRDQGQLLPVTVAVANEKATRLYKCPYVTDDVIMVKI